MWDVAGYVIGGIIGFMAGMSLGYVLHLAYRKVLGKESM